MSGSPELKHVAILRTLARVHDLVARGMRPSLIATIVPTTPKTVGQIYKSLMGRSAASGQPPTNALHYLRKKDQYATLGALMAIAYFRQQTDKTSRSICPDSLCVTVDFIRANVARSDIYHPLLTSDMQPTADHIPRISGTLIEMLYFIVRDITIKQADLVKCTAPSCGRPYIWHNLASATSTTLEPCPWCRINHRYAGNAGPLRRVDIQMANELNPAEQLLEELPEHIPQLKTG